MRIPKAAHPIPQLTDSELRRFRSELEHAIGQLTKDLAMRTVLDRRLTEVVGEQQERRGRNYDLGSWGDL
jgi:hypothetical protein